MLFDFPIDARRYYDISEDGQRFLMGFPTESGSTASINTILNWFEELKQRVPGGR